MEKSEEEMSELQKFVTNNDWMIRPCNIYKLEYNNCTSFKGRFYQYYRDGETEDCGNFYKNRIDCVYYNKSEDYQAGERIIRREMELIAKRKKIHQENDVWERRTEFPPPNWTVPLPKDLEKRVEDSYLEYKADELKKPFEKPSTCVIS